MAVLLPITQTRPHCLLLRCIQFSVGEVDLRLTRGQLRPLQCMKRVPRKENLPYKRAGEERIITLERVQDEISTGGFSTGESLLANSYDRRNLRSELRVGSDFDGFALNLAHVALDFSLVCLEPDVL